MPVLLAETAGSLDNCNDEHSQLKTQHAPHPQDFGLLVCSSEIGSWLTTLLASY